MTAFYFAVLLTISSCFPCQYSFSISPFIASLVEEIKPNCVTILVDSNLTPVLSLFFKKQIPHFLTNKNSAAQPLFNKKSRICNLYLFITKDFEEVRKVIVTNVLENGLNHNAKFLVFSWNRQTTDFLIRDPVITKLGQISFVELVQKKTKQKVTRKLEIVASNAFDDSPSRNLSVIGSYGGKIKGKLFCDRTEGLRGKSLKIITFDVPPSIVVTKTGDKLNYDGIDVNLLKTFAEYMHLKHIISPPTDGQLWGQMKNDGNWTGMMGMIQRSEADVGVANIFLIPQYENISDLSYPYDIDCATFLVPGATPLSPWRSLVTPFQVPLWYWTIAYFLIVGAPVICLLSRIYRKLTKRSPGRHETVGNAVFYSIRSFLGVGTPDDDSEWPVRWYITFFWATSMLLTIGYRASLIASLSLPGYSHPIDTLKQLATSDISWGAYGKQLAESLQSSNDPYAKEVGGTKFIINIDSKTGTDQAHKGVFALMQSKQNVGYISKTQYLDKFGNPTLHVMKECFVSFPIVAAMPKKTPMKVFLDRFIVRLQQTGLVPYWFKSTVFKGSMSEQAKKEDSSDTSTTSFSLSDLQSIFLVLVAGLSVASMKTFWDHMYARNARIR